MVAGTTEATEAAYGAGYSFNLVDEPWIPAMRSAHALPVLFSLREVFAEAPRLWQLADPSPVVTISLYRLLLAILHRSLRGPRTSAEWARIAGRGAWASEEQQRIDGYLSTWRSRFDLFDPRYPFYQTPDLPVNARTGSATVLTQERASMRNQPLLFDHTTSDRAWLTPDAAARALLAQQNFAVGGLISYDTAREPIANKYVGMAPLLGAALCLVRGATLFETLMLNWVAYNPTEAQPFPFWGDDQPAWERDEPTAPSERRPTGYVDLLTWQSRRILLVPAPAPAPAPTPVPVPPPASAAPASAAAAAAAADGERGEAAGGKAEMVVERAVLMKGYQFSPSFERWTAETMVAFRKSARASGSAGQPWYGFSLQPDRVLWRDSPTLLHSVSDAQTRPKTLDWLSALVRGGQLDGRRTLPLEVYGMIPDQANILEWRHESLPLPLALLRDDALLDQVGQAVAFAESVSRLLLPGAVKLLVNGKPAVSTGSPVSLLAEALLVASSDRPPDRRAREDLISSFDVSLPYWAQLDTPFRQCITALAAAAQEAEQDEEQDEEQEGEQEAEQDEERAAVMREWARQVERAVRQVFGRLTIDLDTSSRTLRAVMFARSRFAFCMNALLASWRTDATDATAASTTPSAPTSATLPAALPAASPATLSAASSAASSSVSGDPPL